MDWAREWFSLDLIALLGLKSAQTIELHILGHSSESWKTLNPLRSQQNRMMWSNHLNGYFPALLVP